MHWLFSLDRALFLFINRTLANPFFDWLMPLLSGNGVPWLPAALIAGLVILFRGNVRLKLCALFMVLVVSLGDPLIIGTVKDTVSRPRPFVALPEARLFGNVGKGYVPRMANGELPANANVHSLPSAHAANAFALATLACLFYRRSAHFMFPFAIAVAFSRIYNGVHYPTDVAVGGILGAAYTIAFVLLAQMLWNFIGKKIFPQWHAQWPNLLAPKPSTFNPQPSALDSHWRRLGYIVIALALIGRWVYLASGVSNLTGDEAYQWLWSKHLALSYYSKPPGIAYLQWIGTSLFGDTEFGVRFFSPLIAALMSMLLLRFMAREVGGRPAFVVVLMTFAAPLLIVGSVLMTIDPPLVLGWMVAVVTGWRASRPDGKTSDWLLTGLAMGLAFLFKYTAALQLLCWIIFFAMQPSARIQLRKIGPWLALGIFALCTLPVLVWNSQHGWITIHHVAGDAGMLNQASAPISLLEHIGNSLAYFGEFTGLQLGLLNPIFFIAALGAMLAAWKRREEKPLWFFLFCMSAPLFFGYWLFSFHSRVLANWIAAAVPPMFCLTVAFWNENKFRVKPWLGAAMLIGIVASVFMHDSRLLGRIVGHPLPGDADPAHRSAGWRETAQLVETERVRFDTNAFIIADHYSTTGLYSFYSAPARAAASTALPLVYCLDSDEPMNQFFFWDEYNYRQHRQGANALYVIRLDPYKLEHGWFWKWLKNEPLVFREIPEPRTVPPHLAAEFESITDLGVREIKIKDGRIFQRVQIFGCTHLK